MRKVFAIAGLTIYNNAMSQELEIIDPTKPKPPPTDAQAQAAVEVLKPKFNFDLTKQKALALLGKWQEVPGVNHVSMAMSFHQMSQVEYAQMHAAKIMDNDKVDPKTKILAGMLMVQATKAAIELMDLQRVLVKEGVPQLGNGVPRNAPPNMLIHADGEVHIHEAQKPNIE
jgi:hypothetical protein